MRLLPVVLLAACGSSSNPDSCDPTADTCAGSDICLVDSCVAAFPLPYEAFQLHAEAPGTHDLQVLFATGAHGDPPKVVAMSTVVTGGVADFTGSLVVDLASETDTLSAELVDATTGDLLLACAREPIDMDQLRRRDDNCDKEGYRLSYEITPLVAMAD